MDHEETITFLTGELDRVLDSNFLTYQQAIKISTPGVYFVYKGDQVIYVGKTGRNGKARIRELTKGYLAHPLNRKLLRQKLSEKLKANYPPLNKETKHRLIWVSINVATKR